jgi:hypothetical protein
VAIGADGGRRIGTIAHHIRGAAYAGAATARGHYDHQRERLDHVRGLTRRFGHWRESTTPTDDSDDDTDNDSPGAATPRHAWRSGWRRDRGRYRSRNRCRGRPT